MSEKTSNLPLLASPVYRGLKWPRDVNEWLAAWAQAVESKNVLSMTELLHHGLRRHMNLSDMTAIRVFIHYLQVADGHRSERNFGNGGSEMETPFGRMSYEKVLQTLAVKAWQELCSRFFDFNKETTGRSPTYFSLMLKPLLAEAILDFIDPTIGRGDKFFNSNRVNVESRPEKPDEENTKALKFVRYYLRSIFDFGDDREQYRNYFYYKDDRDEKRLRDKKLEYDGALSYFFNQRPRIIIMMNYYGVLDHLRVRVLDDACLTQVQKLALGMTWDGENPRAQSPFPEAAFELDSKYDFPSHVLGNRTAVDIVLQHPQVLAAYEKWVAERKKAEDEKREQEIAAKERELQDLQDQVEKMRNS